MKQILTLVFLLVAFVFPAAAQTGSISGTIRDTQTGEELIGANVLLHGGSHGGATDLKGRFLIRNIPVGTYDVRFSYVGYGSTTMKGIVVKADEVVRIDVTLKAESFETEEVVVEAERKLLSEAGMLAARKNDSRIGDGITVEQVKRSPDATSGDALKRVTGVTIQDNKFVYVRGVSDRYNSAQLNGVTVTSTDNQTDKKSFAFDLIPANLIENMTVVKSATPDLPGDFTGGLVQVNTLDFPDQMTLKASFSVSGDNVTTGELLYKSQGASSDWLGMDDGYRDPLPNAASLDVYALGNALKNNYAPRHERAPLNGSMNLSAGTQFELGKDKLGFVGGLSYRNGFQRTEYDWRYAAGIDDRGVGSRVIGKGTQDNYSVLWGALLNTAYHIGSYHKISFQNNFNQSANDFVGRILDGMEGSPSLDRTFVAWDERSGLLSQLSGEHKLTDFLGATLTWKGAYSQALAKEPDRKEVNYDVNTEPAPALYNAYRGWSDLREFARNFSADLTVPAGDVKFKTGGMYEKRTRDYQVQFFESTLEQGPSADYSLLILPIDQIFDPENYHAGGFRIYSYADRTDYYIASLELISYFAMLDYRFSIAGQNFRLVGGARAENAEILVDTEDPGATGRRIIGRKKNVDALPSGNLAWIVNDWVNLRLAYYKALNRQEFRELANYSFYDYNTFQYKIGNPSLERSRSDNYDVRIEIFPALGEVLAVSYFHKQIHNPIEQVVFSTTGNLLSWDNSPDGTNSGFEVEVRKNFGFLGSLIPALGDYPANFALGVNYTNVTSEVKFNYLAGSEGTRILTREMQGQSPWVININLSLREPTLGTSFSVLYNKFGRTLDLVAREPEEDVFKEPRGVLDFSVIQPLPYGLEIKFAVKDWNAERQRYTLRENKGIVIENDEFVPIENLYRRMYRGTSYTLQLSYTM